MKQYTKSNRLDWRSVDPFWDMIVDRYEVRCLLYRAEGDSRLMEDDRIAILYDALAKAKRLTLNHTIDQQNIRALADVAVEVSRRTGDPTELDYAISLFSRAQEELLDHVDGDIQGIELVEESAQTFLDE